MELDAWTRIPAQGHGMHALAWFGVILLAFGLLAYVIFKVTVWIAVVLFVAGILFIAWGATKVKRAI